MSSATLISTVNFRSAKWIQAYRYSIPTIPVSSISDEYSLDEIPSKGLLNCFRIVNNSRNYDIFLRQQGNLVIPPDYHIDEILRVVDIDRVYGDSNLGIYYTNRDSIETDTLYLTILNNDPDNATGVVTLELYVEALE